MRRSPAIASALATLCLLGAPLDGGARPWVHMAQNTADAPTGRDVLVGGAGAVADARSPALVAIDAGDKPISRGTKLELTLEPAVVADEPYLVVVSLYRRDGPGPRLGTV